MNNVTLTNSSICCNNAIVYVDDMISNITDLSNKFDNITIDMSEIQAKLDSENFMNYVLSAILNMNSN